MAACDNVVSASWFDYINLTPQKDWDYWGLSANPNITWDIVSTNPDKDWNYAYLSKNLNITWVLNLQKGKLNLLANNKLFWCLPTSKYPELRENQFRKISLYHFDHSSGHCPSGGGNTHAMSQNFPMPLEPEYP